MKKVVSFEVLVDEDGECYPCLEYDESSVDMATAGAMLAAAANLALDGWLMRAVERGQAAEVVEAAEEFLGGG